MESYTQGFPLLSVEEQQAAAKSGGFILSSHPLTVLALVLKSFNGSAYTKTITSNIDWFTLSLGKRRFI